MCLGAHRRWAGEWPCRLEIESLIQASCYDEHSCYLLYPLRTHNVLSTAVQFATLSTRACALSWY